MQKARVLIVGLERNIFKKIEPILSRSNLAADRVATASSGLLLTGQATFEMLVVRHPLPDAALGSFISDVHSPGRPNGATPIMILADDNRIEELQRLLGGSGKEVLSVNEPAKLLQGVASRLLKVAPRVETRILVRLEVKLGTGTTKISCQSENLSEGGLLLRTDTVLPIGTRLQFDFSLPGERSSIQGEGEVMRHAVPDVERLQGMGLKIAFFKGDGAKRVKQYLAQTKKK